MLITFKYGMSKIVYGSSINLCARCFILQLNNANTLQKKLSFNIGLIIITRMIFLLFIT